MVIPQAEYERIVAQVPIVCVDIIISYQGKILMVKRADEPAKGEWWLPGGRLHKGESIEACALRKAKEETGLDCHCFDISHFDSTEFATGPGGVPIHTVNFYVLMGTNSNEVKLDSTSIDYQWIDRIDPTYHPYIKNCLIEVLDD